MSRRGPKAYLLFDDDFQGPLAPRNRLNVQVGPDFSYIKIVSMLIAIGGLLQIIS